MTRNRGPIDSAATGSVAARPDLLAHPSSALTRLVRLNIKLVRRTLLSKRINRLLVWCQQHLGPAWVDYCTRNIRRVHGLDRLPPRESIDNFILIANHRSYFDLFVASMVLFRDKRIRSRIVFTVRSSFFYDRPLGFLVNGVMSFFAMYPPVFRERDINTRQGLKNIAMRRYISDFDRALNLASVPFFKGQAEDRAMAMYAEDERLKTITELNDAADMVSARDKAQGVYIKRDIQNTTMRASDYGWQKKQ